LREPTPPTPKGARRSDEELAADSTLAILGESARTFTTYTWKVAGTPFATLAVPPGFTEYGGSGVTRLAYAAFAIDLLIQRSGRVRHVSTGKRILITRTLPDRVVRVGSSKTLVWREDEHLVLPLNLHFSAPRAHAAVLGAVLNSLRVHDPAALVSALLPAKASRE
jgi:hypothetical protein